MWVDIEAPEGVTEADYKFLPSKMTISRAGKSRVHLVPTSRYIHIHIQLFDIWRV